MYQRLPSLVCQALVQKRLFFLVADSPALGRPLPAVPSRLHAVPQPAVLPRDSDAAQSL